MTNSHSTYLQSIIYNERTQLDHDRSTYICTLYIYNNLYYTIKTQYFVHIIKIRLLASGYHTAWSNLAHPFSYKHMVSTWVWLWSRYRSALDPPHYMTAHIMVWPAWTLTHTHNAPIMHTTINNNHVLHIRSISFNRSKYQVSGVGYLTRKSRDFFFY